jgi:nitroreductase
MDNGNDALRTALAYRFGTPAADIAAGAGPDTCPDTWLQLAKRGSCRHFTDRTVASELIETLCALALSSPSKSDLQQRDIVIIDDPALRARLDTLMTTGPLAQAWISSAPSLLVFCGNNRRQRQIHEWREKPFVNDHLDAFFNASVDAGITLTAFVVAAEAAGLGCTPISAIRNHAQEVSDLLGLPDHVFPVAGLGLGWPKWGPRISPRLPLAATVHRNTFSETGLKETVEAYDRRRNGVQPMQSQRAVEHFGKADFYGWSEDKARQYAGPERADFGAFVLKKGFVLR